MVLTSFFKRFILYSLALTGFGLIIFLAFTIQKSLKKSEAQFYLNTKVEYENILSSFKFNERAVLQAIDDFHKKYAETDLHEKLKSILKNQGLSIESIFETWTVRNVLKAKLMVISFYNTERFLPADQVLELGIDAWGNPLWLDVNPVSPKKDTGWVFSINSKGENEEKDTHKSVKEDDDINVFVNKKEFSLLTATHVISNFNSVRKKRKAASNKSSTKIVTLEELLNQKEAKEKQ